ncbi:SDR family oxidoreductase [Catalinimonas niigatensis]|uniref:SDR family oxidoreductase n=1 Tax=Catalinimonas niigatensis TaxID=1397264 RepID=UPI002665EF23|nr:SDR family oxidoreductase [Catalinimonas niigatensis]WPP51082.1 SDR family oxidoreductase [Catalinimonas niigatensis]
MDKTILITGGSRGIGAATALLAAQKGYQVCINYWKSKDAALKIVDCINQQGGKSAAFQADVSSETQVIALFEAVDRLGSLSALVNNVGILEKQMRVEEMAAERLQRIFNHNILSCFLCTKEAIKRMSTRYGGMGGAIVNVSSIAARTGAPGEYVDYATSKGAMDTFTLGVAKEVAAEGIRVNGVRPAFIYTDIHASGGEPGRVDRIKDTIPMKRGGKVEEVAQAILWLLSEEASYCTGTFIDISGGK